MVKGPQKEMKKHASVHFASTNLKQSTVVHEKLRNCAAQVQWCRHSAPPETNGANTVQALLLYA